jgi:hypothetical protein
VNADFWPLNFFTFNIIIIVILGSGEKGSKRGDEPLFRSRSLELILRKELNPKWIESLMDMYQTVNLQSSSIYAFG